MGKQRGTLDLALIGIIALVLSIALNVWLWHEKGVEHDARTTAETSLNTANTATETCNKSIAGLETAAEARGAAAERGRQAAADKRRQAEKTAQQILSTPASTPGNDCKSAHDRMADWLKGRKP